MSPPWKSCRNDACHRIIATRRVRAASDAARRALALSSSTAPALDLLRGLTMGTSWSVRLAASKRDLHSLHARIQHTLDQVVTQMSTWEANSDINRFNHSAPGWVRLPAHFLRVLKCARKIAEASNGAFDPTIGTLVGMWGFGAYARAQAPCIGQLQLARDRAGWRKLYLDTDAGAAFQPGGVCLDLSAIAKGFGVDLVADLLRQRRIDSALIEVGGELAAIGRKPDGSRWRILAESDPQRDDGEPTILALADCAVATSGDRWHRYNRDGVQSAHILDPHSGRPLPRPPLAVTVIAADAMQADGWATALSVLGSDAGLALAQTRGLAVRFVEADDAGGRPTSRCSPGFSRYLAE